MQNTTGTGQYASLDECLAARCGNTEPPGGGQTVVYTYYERMFGVPYIKNEVTGETVDLRINQYVQLSDGAKVFFSNVNTSCDENYDSDKIIFYCPSGALLVDCTLIGRWEFPCSPGTSSATASCSGSGTQSARFTCSY